VLDSEMKATNREGESIAENGQDEKKKLNYR
jgi:hypothetical protein